jgi:hypothetical protein
MKIDDLVKLLNNYKKKYGNLKVFHWDTFQDGNNRVTEIEEFEKSDISISTDHNNEKVLLVN